MRWLTHDWLTLLPAPWAQIALVLVALVCGGIVGAEFEYKRKSVGVHTLTLVSFGAAVFTMVNAALDFRTPIAAQVVSGIGFLGAGVILRGPYGIMGLTSAAMIWAMAAIGMTVGLGYAGAGVALSFLLLGSSSLISVWQHRFFAAGTASWAILTYRVNGGKTIIKIKKGLGEYDFPASSYEMLAPLSPAGENGQPGAAGLGRMRVLYHETQRRHRECLAYLASLTEVEEICSEPAVAADVLPGSRSEAGANSNG